MSSEASAHKAINYIKTPPCEPNGQSKEPAWKPFTYRARARSRPNQRRGAAVAGEAAQKVL